MSASGVHVFSGSCLCGAPRFTLSGASSRPFYTIAIIAKLDWNSSRTQCLVYCASFYTGRNQVRNSTNPCGFGIPGNRNPIHHNFCSGCGRNLWLSCPYIPDMVSVTSGPIDMKSADLADDEVPDKREPVIEIFCRAKVPWVEITRSTVQWQGQKGM